MLSRSLTGFGPTAGAEKTLQRQDSKYVGSVTIYTPPFVLAPARESPAVLLAEASTTSDTAASAAAAVEQSGVLLCAYCLSEDQRWLLASCTDSHGEILDTRCINIEIPNRNRRKKASVRRFGLRKLWEFLLGIMSNAARPWRVVIGRFGRLGHGELKGNQLFFQLLAN